MDEDNIITLRDIKDQIRAREEELEKLHGELDAQHVAGRIQAREEALERLCIALQYLQNSMAEVKATRARLDMERGIMMRELRESRARAEELDAELRSVRLAHREVERQMESDDDDTDPTPSGAR
jgi:chromosome segregation ATPase